MPALTGLLTVVAGLDHGAVILPGLDRRVDATEWAAIAADEAHPQHLLALLLQELELDLEDVRDWPPAPHPDRLPAGGERKKSRVGLVGEALRPAATTDAWRGLGPVPAEALAGVSRFDCIGPQHEAVTIALLLRRKLEMPGATAALVTPDRDLARRVAAELRRWGVEIDDSAGLPLSRTPPGVFLRHVVELAESQLAPVPLLATLKHPLAAGGLTSAEFRELTRRLESKILGPRPAPGFAGLRDALGGKAGRLRHFVGRLEACLGPLPDLLTAPAVPLSRLVEAHVAAAERLSASATESGADRLWAEPAGEVAARFCHELIDAARDFPAMAGRDYAALYEALAAGAVVRPAWGRHPRLAIWGLVEARLQQADLVVLGGLNEGSWPGMPEHDPWMSRPMRRACRLAVPERAIGIAAHDFAQAMGAPEVALTRAARREGVPTVPSRWLLRLDAVLNAVGLAGALASDPTIEDAAALIDDADWRPAPPVRACPPLAARPRTLSVTQIETWFRDPYAIYARHILDLRKLDDLDADPGRAELGIRIHEALDKFVSRLPTTLPADPEAELLRIGHENFGPILSRPGVWAFWWPRFERIARWFVAEERDRRRGLVESLSERDGVLVLKARGGPFTLKAQADRIDRHVGGGLVLIDYKTGSLPSNKEIEQGFAPQLPLEGAILRDGNFGEIRGVPTALEYWRLSGSDPAGKRNKIGGDDPGALIDFVLNKTRTLIDRFDQAATPYYAVPSPRYAPRYSDYRQLERLGEIEIEE